MYLDGKSIYLQLEASKCRYIHLYLYFYLYIGFLGGLGVPLKGVLKRILAVQSGYAVTLQRRRQGEEAAGDDRCCCIHETVMRPSGESVYELQLFGVNMTLQANLVFPLRVFAHDECAASGGRSQPQADDGAELKVSGKGHHGDDNDNLYGHAVQRVLDVGCVHF